jgi:transcription antitermination factor NusG
MVDEREIEMKTVAQINSAILAGSFSAEEIRSISQAVSIKFKEMQRVATVRFAKGDKVKFETRSGETITGTVARINQKTVTVNTPTSQWKVSGSLLKRV